MLQLIIGGSGCGKTYTARQLLAEAASVDLPPVMLVPEQFSFESERAMLHLLGAAGSRGVEVFSFTRLAERVERVCGGTARRRLNDCGRVAVMKEALSSLDGQLSFYGGGRPSYTFIDHLLDAVKEFKLCALTPAMLHDASREARGTLRVKLSELALIFGAYEAVTAQTMLDPLDPLDTLYTQLGQYRFFDGRTVILDSFRGFTGQESRIIERIFEQAEKCIITLHAESLSDGENGLFSTSADTARQLINMAREHGISVAPTITLPERHRFSSPAIASVEAQIFRFDGERDVYDHPAPEITVCETFSRYDEAEYCARECRRLMREEGYRCRDIAVIARSGAVYSDMIFDSLEAQGIPCFLDRRTDAASSALMQFVLSLLDIVKGGRQTEDILRWLKTGLVSDIDAQDIAELENYCYVWGINGRRLFSPLTQNPDGFAPEMTDRQKARLGRINEVRERICSLIDRFSTEAKGSGADMSAAVYHLLDAAGTPDMLRKLAASLPAQLGDEQGQLWDALMSILDQIAFIIGERHIPFEEFAACVSFMISRCDIGHIPQGLDEVTFGSADRIRTTAPRAVFIIGALENEFPAVPENSGVFTDEERRRLRGELNIPVAEPLEHSLLEERLMLYNALSAASDRLYITYPTGQGEIRSEFVGEVLSIVPGANVISYGGGLCISDIEAAGAAFELAARHRRDNTALSASLTECVSRREEGARMKAVERAAGEDIPALGAAQAQRLFGGGMYISPSRAETYHKCRFKFFCRYGLAVDPLRRARLDVLQFGTAAHFVLEHIFGGEDTPSYDVLSSDAQTVRSLVSRLLMRYLAEEMGGDEDKSYSMLYQLRRMADSLTELVMNFAGELCVSDFKPVAFELSVSPDGDVPPSEIRLPDGSVITVIGKVDRVDMMEKGGRGYLRVIDYKTGSKKFDLSDVVDGLNMQMLIYLGELCREGGYEGNPSPAGILYCPAFSGTVKGERDQSGDSLRKARSSALRRSGIIIDDTDDLSVCRASEPDLGGVYIPIKLTNKGELSKFCEKYIITPAAYDITADYVRLKLCMMGITLSSGRISPDPVLDGYSPCDNCEYYAVCRYEGELRRKFSGNGNGDAVMRMAEILKEAKEAGIWQGNTRRSSKTQ